MVAILQEIPTRGSFATLPPTDPTIYRLYEVLQVYGPALKALIHEDFGDGIMSAINFNLALERGEAESGPRVRITLDGTWLPYQWQIATDASMHGPAGHRAGHTDRCAGDERPEIGRAGRRDERPRQQRLGVPVEPDEADRLADVGLDERDRAHLLGHREQVQPRVRHHRPGRAAAGRGRTGSRSSSSSTGRGWAPAAANVRGARGRRRAPPPPGAGSRWTASAA